MYGRVAATEQLTPTDGSGRVVGREAGGAGATASADVYVYVNVAIPPSGAPYAAPFDLARHIGVTGVEGLRGVRGSS
ncbi:MAG: hypothetical protein KY460_03605 [Actinobacteria bacterium]|nr:hypothetical protein [Actinomycetota bacterium]